MNAVAAFPGFQHALVLLCAIAVGVCFGLSYGLETQAVYLMHPLRTLDPEFLRFDWHAAHTTMYHPHFSLLISALSLFAPLPWGVAIANVALVTVYILAIYVFLLACFRRDAFLTIVLLMFLVVLERTTSIAVSHILTFRFEPSSVAACGVMIALLLMLSERYAWSGLVLAIAGFFHANYLILDFVFFGCAHMALGRRGLVHRLLVQLGPSLVPLGIALPMIYAVAADPLADQARYILQFIRAPHHYAPGADLSEFSAFFGWHLLALSCIGLAGDTRGISSRLVRVYLVFTTLVIVVAIFSTVVHVPHVSQLTAMRMAPFAILLGQLIILTNIVPMLRADASRPATTGQAGWRPVSATLGGIALLTYYALATGPLDIALAVVAVAVLLAFHRSANGDLAIRRVDAPAPWFRFGTEGLATGALVLALLAAILPPGFLGGHGLSRAAAFHKRYNVVLGEPKPFRELYAFARSTAPESQFVVPPNLSSFRVFGERAIVVDWQSTPMIPFEWVEWYRRLGEISGRPAVKSLAGAVAGYAQMDQARVDRIAERYGADYVVHRKPFDPRRINGKVVFSNSRFLVFHVNERRP
ncbi:MAG: hypothetical protein M3O61_05955 [Gemmatimonadota bacterium]|nr:hypothetical protein [Gemmatimonadota bacterium]